MATYSNSPVYGGGTYCKPFQTMPLSCSVKGSRKEVDYSKFGGGGGFEDEDDDFADATPPAAKKPKKEKLKKEKKTTKDKEEKDSFKPSVKVNRVSLDEKLFDRQLQEALELSKLETGHSEEEGPPSLEYEKKEILVEVELTSPPELSSNKENSSRNDNHIVTNSVKNNGRASCEMPDLDKIEILSENVTETTATSGRGRRAAAAPKKRKKYIDDYEDELSDSDAVSDDDFKVDDGVASSEEEPEDDDFDPDDDSDYEGGSKKRKKGKAGPAKKTKSSPKMTKPPGAKKSTPAAAPKSNKARGLTKSATASPVTPNMPNLHKVTPASQRKPLVKTPIMPSLNKASPLTVVRRPSLPIPSGKSPGLGGVVIKSPGTATSGVLRQGLSRRANIKPLHSNVKLVN